MNNAYSRPTAKKIRRKNKWDARREYWANNVEYQKKQELRRRGLEAMGHRLS